MYCPSCRYEVMGRVPYRSMDVHRCRTCGGMFLERDEVGAVLGKEVCFSPVSDAGNRTPRHCFRCSIDMVPVTDPQGQPIDRCEICGAVFIPIMKS